MNLRAAVGLLGLALALVPAVPAQAGEDGTLRRLRGAFESAPAGAHGARTGELLALRAELERRDEAWRAQFELLGRSALPARAAQGLAGAQAAYAAGQGRLLEILRSLERKGGPDPAAWQEARAIVARLEAASRPEPLSSELRVRAPRVQAPPLPEPLAGASAAGASLEAAAPIGSIPPSLQNLADQLGGALAIYTWVRNNVAPDFYHGVLKGPLQTWVERSGNDADTAALLVTLLRARGIPARYVSGTAEVPAQTLRRLVGSGGTIEDALRVLQRAGIPHEPVLAGSGIGSVKVARVWAEAYLPYANYRGLELDPQGPVWVPLDAAFKLLEEPSGFDVVSELGFDPAAAWEEYLQAPGSETPGQRVRARIEELLAAQRPGTPYESVLNRRQVELELLGILPSTLPYQATGASPSFDLPEGLFHELRLVAEQGGSPVLEARFKTSDLLGGRVTLSYVPFSPEDVELVERFGGLYQTPPYLFDVKAVVSVDGIPTAAASAPLGMGTKFGLRLEVSGPGAQETVTNTLLAGNLAALGLGARVVPPTPVAMDAAPRLLAGLAMTYLSRWSAADEELSRVLRVVPVRPTLSAAFAMSDIEVEYAGGDPAYPLSFVWSGVLIDADFRPMAPVGVERREREPSFALLSGLAGSVLEGQVLEQELGVASASTVTVLQQAHAQGLLVHEVDQANVEAVLPGLPFDETVKGEIRDAAQRGLLVRVPADDVTLVEWTGVGYVLRDPLTGEAAYQLQGGHSGGVTVAVNGFPPAIKDVLTLEPKEQAECREQRAAAVHRLSDDFQLGTVHKPLADALRVRVVDSAGKAIKKACVTFQVLGGGGKLTGGVGGGEYDQLTVRADDSGEAKVTLKLGKKTTDYPAFICEEGRNCSGEGTDEYTQVGYNIVTARAGVVRLDEPFTHLGKPDAGCNPQGQNCNAELKLTNGASGDSAILSVARLMSVRAIDPHENPISNFEVRFAFRAPVELGQAPTGWVPARPVTTGAQNPGRVLKPKDFNACTQTQVHPGWGECAGEAAEVKVKSGPSGVHAYSVVGDSPFSIYTFEIGTTAEPGRLTSRVGTYGWICTVFNHPLCQQPTTTVFHGTRVRRVNKQGDYIEAYPAGQGGDVALYAVSYLEDNHVEAHGEDEEGPIWFAVGENTYKREVLTDSQFRPTPVTPGTVMGAPPHVGGGVYRGTMQLADTPQKNRVVFDARHFPNEVRYKPRDPVRVLPGTVADGKALRSKDLTRPWQGQISFELWGVKAEIDAFDPKSIYVDDRDRALHNTLLRSRIQPVDWRKLLEPWQVQFRLKDSGGAEKVAAQGNAEAVFTIPRGAVLPPGTYKAELGVISINWLGGKLDAAPKTVKTGLVNLVLDANNDTKVDDADAQLLKTNPGATFEFWEADPNRPAKAKDDAPHLHRLEEYATVRVRVPFAAPEELMFLTVHGAGFGLRISRHVGQNSECGTKSYLCSRSLAELQESELGAPIGSTSEDGAAPIFFPLQEGDNDLVFSCGPYTSGSSCLGATSLALERRVDGNRETLIERAVRFRKINDLLTVYSARREGIEVRGRAEACVTSEQQPSPPPGCAQGWKELPPPAEAPRVFVFVHGYNVNQADNESIWFPIVFKRLYWAGLPLIAEQQQEASKRVHMVAFGWPGNQGILGEFGSSAMYIENEMNAHQSGVPLALLLTETLRGREISMLAHSLGNMTASSALALAPAGTVKTFVMNDAAMAAEAFVPGPYGPLSQDEENELGPHTRRYGRPADVGTGGIPVIFPPHNWIRDWEEIVAQHPGESLTCATNEDPVPSDFTRWTRALTQLRVTSPHLDPLPQYDRRWRQFGANASAWTGVYFDVVGKTRLINTYNPNDYVITLRDVDGTQWWLFAQRFGKPHFGPFGAGADNKCALYWAPLEDMDIAQQSQVWSAGRFSPLQADTSERGLARLTRTWAERVYWFPAISTSAGARNLAPFVESESFETEGQLFHSYLYRERPLPSVWKPYVTIKNYIQ